MKKEEFKNELKRKILLNDFWNESKEVVVFEMDEEKENIKIKIEELLEDLETIYNIKKIDFITVKALKVEKNTGVCNYIFYKINFEIELYFNTKLLIASSSKKELINFYVNEEGINFIQ